MLFTRIIISVNTVLGVAEVNEKLRGRIRLEQHSLIISEELLVVDDVEVSWQDLLDKQIVRSSGGGGGLMAMLRNLTSTADY